MVHEAVDRARQPLAILHHEVAQRRTVAVHPEREHGAAGNLERHPLHRFTQIDRLTAFQCKFCDRLVGDRRELDEFVGERSH